MITTDRPGQNAYCLDTSALIYIADNFGHDVFPEVWEHLSDLVLENVVIAPKEVRRELQKKEDNGAWNWANSNRALFRSLDAQQSEVVAQIVSKPEFNGLVDFDAELSDAGPFVVALAVTYVFEGGLFSTPTSVTVVGVDSPARQVGLADVCHAPEFGLRFLDPFEMLIEIGLDVPGPEMRGLSDLYGSWADLGITEAEIEGAKIRFRGVDL